MIALDWLKAGSYMSLFFRSVLIKQSCTCSLITTFIANCYIEPARLFVIGNNEIKSREGTRQGNPTAMGAYAVGVTTPLIHFLSEFIFINKRRSKEVAFADDYTAAEKASEIKPYWIYYNNKGLSLATSPNHANRS